MPIAIVTQRGAVLVVTIVILFLITLISITQLSSANNQHKMVTNLQQFNQTFNAAESALAEAFHGVENMTTIANKNMAAMADAVSSQKSEKVDMHSLSDKSLSISLTYTAIPNTALHAGISLDASSSDVMIQHVNFIVKSTAKIKNSGATSTISKGVIYE